MKGRGISKRSLPVLLGCAALLVPGSAAAATIDVEIRTDEFDDNGDCSLREAVQSANADGAAQMESGCVAGLGADVITLHAGDPYTLTTPIDGTPDITDGDLELMDLDGAQVLGDGAGTTIIDGGDHDRIFEVIAGGLTVDSLTVRNGLVATAVGGGGILSSAAAGTLALTDVAVTQNQVSVTGTGGGGVALEGGGSLAVSGTSQIDGNVSTGFGGGISHASDGNVTLNPGVTVDGNSGVGFGGGVFVGGNGTLTIDGASVSDNQLAENATQIAIGSAISSSTNAVGISDAMFNGNDSVGDKAGPAVDLFAVNPAQIDSTTISGNTATGEDDLDSDVLGPAGIRVNDSAGTTIADSTISSNSVTGADTQDPIFGGGIYVVTPLTLTGSTLALNSVAAGSASSRGGGGMYIEGSAQTGILNATFTGNDAAGGVGGAINLQLNGQLTVGQSTFSGNMAPQGAAINTQGGASSILTMRGSIFTEGATACSFGGGGTVNADSFNVDADTSCVGATDDTDYENTLALLGPLADNGGPTETKALVDFDYSPIVNGGGACTQLDGSTPLLVDQRGAPRPADGGCEPGSYERINCLGSPVPVGTAGPDVFVGTSGSDRFHGLGGNDVIGGGGGMDILCGGDGNDELTGGANLDVVLGNDGDDDLFLRDGDFDTGDCGAGTDTAEVDPGGIDTAADCETVNDGTVPPPPASGAGTTTAPTPAPTINPLCATLRKKLRKARKAGNGPLVRKLRRKLRRLGC